MNKWKRRIATAGRAELLACDFLLQQGYQVFRNIWHHGPVDIVGFKDGRYYGFDVKAFDRWPPTCKTAEQKQQKVHFIFVCPATGECYFERHKRFDKKLHWPAPSKRSGA